MNRELTYEKVQYGTLVEVIREHGGYHAGMSVYFFNHKGVLVGNDYKFYQYSKLRIREPYEDGRNRDYSKFFMHENFEGLKMFLFKKLCKIVTFLIKFTQKYMHKY